MATFVIMAPRLFVVLSDVAVAPGPDVTVETPSGYLAKEMHMNLLPLVLRRGLRIRFWMVVLCSLVAGEESHAQAPGASFSGMVRDERGQAVPGAELTFVNTATGFRRVARARDNGTYWVEQLQPGRYTLTVRKEGFQELEIRDLAAGFDQTVTLNPQLKLFMVQETIEVVGEAPLIEVTQSDLSSTIPAEVVEKLAIDARDVLNLAYLSPGVFPARRGGGYDQITEIGVGPDQGQDTMVNVDGGSINDPAIGFPFSSVPIEAVEAFEFLPQRYSAEYGGGSGGVINVLTKSGTNEFHGSAFGFFRNESFVADDFFGGQENPSHRAQYGFSFGGPIRQDVAHFFVAYDGAGSTQTQTVDTGGANPAIEGPIDVDINLDRVLVRLDGSPNTANRLGARYVFSSYRDQFFSYFPPGLTARSARVRTDGPEHSLVLSHDWTGSSAIQNQFVVHLHRIAVDLQSTGEGSFEERPSSYSGRAFFLPQDRTDDRLQFTDTFSYYVPQGQGGHLLKLGAGAEILDIDFQAPNFANGYFLFETDTAFDSADPSTYPTLLIQGTPFGGNRMQRTYSVFANDDWTATSRLTFNLGVRYELNDGALNENDPSQVPYLPPPEQDTDNVSPRLGLVYQVRNDGRLVARGGYGRHYTHVWDWLSDAVFPNSRLVTTNPDYQGFTNPNGSSSESDVSVQGTDPDIEIPYSDQFSGGVDWQFLDDWAVAADYVGTRGHGQIVNLESNPVVDQTTGERLYPAYGSVPAFASIGSSTYDGLQVHVRGRGAWGAAGVSYTLSRARNDHDFTFDYVVRESDLDAREGASLNDAHHRFVAYGAASLPLNVTLGGTVTLSTAQPFDANTGEDLNGDGDLDRLAGEERNSRRGDSYARVDLRLAYVFRLGQTRVEPTFEVFNLFNTENIDPDTINGNILSPLFGTGGTTLHPLYQPLQLQLGVRFGI